jgi:uncharacterized membrane protein YkoI
LAQAHWQRRITDNLADQDQPLNQEIPMNITQKLSILLVAASGLALSGVAVADRDDIRLLSETKITLVEAIEIAEAHQGGVAYDAKLDDDSFTPEYEIDLVVEDRIYEVTVDGVTGEIRKVKEDHDD